MDYQEQLKTKEWRLKRLEILERDNNCCRICNIKRSDFLHLSNNFGVKTYEEMLDDGYWVFKGQNQNNYRVRNIKDFVNNAKYIGKDKVEPEELKFAIQYVENIEGDPIIQLICFDKSISEELTVPDLNIHHKYYIKDQYAWEYDNEALLTLCVDCHSKVHLENKIPVYNKNREFLTYSTNCNKCNGSGYLPQYHYHKNGVCFDCFGFGDIFT